VTDLLEVAGLGSAYGAITVLHDISFSVAPGTVTGLLGRNGAGKTTVLRAVSGLNPATTGHVRLSGRDVTGLAPDKRVREGIAYVQEGKRIFGNLTVEQNLILGGYAGRLGRREVRERVERQLERFPVLAGRLRASASGLSGGQQQMLAIAQALVSGPQVLLLDEPSGGLAPSVVGELLQTVRRLVDEGLSVVLVEQAVNFALSVADRVLVMDLGRVVLDLSASAEGLAERIEQAYFAHA
jgi:branched-chain amino acid transport system ATP-binding protein